MNCENAMFGNKKSNEIIRICAQSITHITQSWMPYQNIYMYEYHSDGYYAHMAKNRHVISNGMWMKALYRNDDANKPNCAQHIFNGITETMLDIMQSIMPHVCCAVLAPKSSAFCATRLKRDGRGQGIQLAILNRHYNHLAGYAVWIIYVLCIIANVI